MEKIRSIIIEDIPDNRDLLIRYLKDCCPEVHVVSTCQTITEAFEEIKNQKPDLIFLDIKLGAESGFTILEIFEDTPFDVIFVTAFEEYFPASFEYSALDYVMKPISRAKLRAAVDRFKSANGRRSLKRRISNFLNNQEESDVANQSFLIKDRQRGLVELPFKDILRIEADGAYSNIYPLNHPSPVVISKNIGEIAKTFPEELFFLSHKSHLVNGLFIKRLPSGRRGNLVLINGENIPVAERRMKACHQFFRNFQ